jgi:membrane associated rhomboid family serine protease
VSFEDRDWIREPEPRGWSFGRLNPLVALVAGTTVAFFLQMAVGNGNEAAGRFIEEHLVLRSRGVLSGEFWQPVTYLLLHGDLAHLFWNMFSLWVFGGILRDLVSDRTLWITYLVGGVTGAAACILWDLAIPSAAGAGVVGASGAVTAVMVGAALRDPRHPIGLFLMPATIPLWLLGIVYIALDLVTAIQMWATGRFGAVAVQAHLGGAASAAVLFLLARTRPARVVRETETPAPKEPDVQARVDALLERIHDAGIGSLSDEEREFLKRASERYRGRGRP